MRLLQIAFGVAAIAIFSGGLGAERLPNSAGTGFSPFQRQVADEIISVFENDTPELQYGYIEDLHDGRGYTAGRGGFTSATGDMLSVVEAYRQRSPGNPLEKYISPLTNKAKNCDQNVGDLADLPKDWTKAADDPGFRQAQDEIVDQQVFQPSLRHWKEEGCQTPLALLIIYDTVIEHGDGHDPDSARAIVRRTDDLLGGSPASGVVEATWLSTLLSVRRSILVHPSDSSSTTAWAASVTRCDALQQLLDGNNFDLSTPLDITVFGETWRLTQDGGFRVN